jgi:hypothetical protein
MVKTILGFGAPMNSRATLAAIMFKKIDIAIWLLRRKCPYNEEMLSLAYSQSYENDNRLAMTIKQFGCARDFLNPRSPFEGAHNKLIDWYARSIDELIVKYI